MTSGGSPQLSIVGRKRPSTGGCFFSLVPVACGRRAQRLWTPGLAEDTPAAAACNAVNAGGPSCGGRVMFQRHFCCFFCGPACAPGVCLPTWSSLLGWCPSHLALCNMLFAVAPAPPCRTCLRGESYMVLRASMSTYKIKWSECSM